jgi:small GTP-binding protein
VNRLIDDHFDHQEPRTVGANWQLFTTMVGSTAAEFQIWDTAGQEKFRSLGPLYYRSALGAVAVFDVSNRSSFESLGSWLTAFTAVASSDAGIVIAANKCDVDGCRRCVGEREALEWARECGYSIYETSALTGQNVQQVFAALAEGIVHQRPEPSAPERPPPPTPAKTCC